MSHGDVIDHLCGEGTPAERDAFRARIANDIDLAIDYAETRDLVESCRGLQCEPSGRVGVVVRQAVLRRIELRRPEVQRLGFFRTAWRVAAVALIWLGLSWALFRSHGEEATALPEGIAGLDRPVSVDVAHQAAAVLVQRRDPELERLLDCEAPAAVDSAAFRASFAKIATTALPDTFSGWLSAENRLAGLRREYDLRYSERTRARARRALGTPDLDERIRVLANELAPRLAPVADVGLEDLAYGIRALLAAGSTSRRGPHRETLHACTEELVARTRGGLEGGELALALAALTDVGVAEDGEIVALLGVEADRLARETLRPTESGRRPALLYWTTPASRLADAGRVLQLAPAFGTHAGLALKARTVIAAHMGERLARRRDAESPALVAAWIYGFGDLIDRPEADHRVSLWRADWLLPNYIALHQFAWSKYPVRRGWADFQLQLRGFAGLPTPPQTRDAAALLLTLTTNVAAPGVLDGVAIADL